MDGMKTLEELNSEWVKAKDSFEMSRKSYDEKVKEIKTAVIEHAKYKTGEKVFYVRKLYNGKSEKLPGIVRIIKGKNYFSDDPILPCYEVGKITKSGAIHASQNIHYGEIYESEMEPFAE